MNEKLLKFIPGEKLFVFNLINRQFQIFTETAPKSFQRLSRNDVTKGQSWSKPYKCSRDHSRPRMNQKRSIQEKIFLHAALFIC